MLLLGGGPTSAVDSIKTTRKKTVGAPKESTSREEKNCKVESKRSKYSQTRYVEAAELVERTSYENLVSKPTKELKQLLKHLDVKCKACNEKSLIVDRLKQVVDNKR